MLFNCAASHAARSFSPLRDGARRSATSEACRRHLARAGRDGQSLLVKALPPRTDEPRKRTTPVTLIASVGAIQFKYHPQSLGDDRLHERVPGLIFFANGKVRPSDSQQDYKLIKGVDRQFGESRCGVVNVASGCSIARLMLEVLGPAGDIALKKGLEFFE